MNTVKVTWLRAAKIYWSLLWRTVLCWTILGAAVSAGAWTLGFVTFSGGPPDPAVADDAMPWVAAVSVLGLIVEIWIVKTVMGKVYSDFRIVFEGPPRRYRIEPRI